MQGEWFADYAHAVLSPHSGCNSEPAWVAWAMHSAAWPAEAGELLVLLSAQDKTAALTLALALALALTLALTLTLTLT